MKKLVFLLFLCSCVDNNSMPENSAPEFVYEEILKCFTTEVTTSYGVEIIEFNSGDKVVSRMLKKDATKLAIAEEMKSLNQMSLCADSEF
jgi:hypothetical protein